MERGEQEKVSFLIGVENSNDPPKSFTLRRGTEGVVTIGRLLESDVLIPLRGVSSVHAELRLRDAGESATPGLEVLSVRDVSMNGTGIACPGKEMVLLKKGVDTPLPDGAVLHLPLRVKGGCKERFAIWVRLERRPGSSKNESAAPALAVPLAGNNALSTATAASPQSSTTQKTPPAPQQESHGLPAQPAPGQWQPGAPRDKPASSAPAVAGARADPPHPSASSTAPAAALASAAATGLRPAATTSCLQPLELPSLSLPSMLQAPAVHPPPAKPAASPGIWPPPGPWYSPAGPWALQQTPDVNAATPAAAAPAVVQAPGGPWAFQQPGASAATPAAAAPAVVQAPGVPGGPGPAAPRAWLPSPDPAATRTPGTSEAPPARATRPWLSSNGSVDDFVKQVCDTISIANSITGRGPGPGVVGELEGLWNSDNFFSTSTPKLPARAAADLPTPALPGAVQPHERGTGLQQAPPPGGGPAASGQQGFEPFAPARAHAAGPAPVAASTSKCAAAPQHPPPSQQPAPQQPPPVAMPAHLPPPPPPPSSRQQQKQQQQSQNHHQQHQQPTGGGRSRSRSRHRGRRYSEGGSRDQPPDITRDAQYYRGKIKDIYRQFNPEKLSEINYIFTKYQGAEEKLYEALCKKYL